MEELKTRIDAVTRKERVIEVTAGMPYTAHIWSSVDLPGKQYPWHWHEEVEIFCLERGHYEHHTPNGVYDFCEGEAGFINANVLHMTILKDDAHLLNEHMVLPSFIAGTPGGDIENRYIRPVLRAEGLEIFKFRNPQRIAELLRRAYEIYSEAAEGFEIRIRMLMSEVWMILYEETREIREASKPRSADDERIRRMVAYIAEHFAEHISMADIARAGLVGERECFRIFGRCLGMTPLECLMSHRVSHAAGMLRATDAPILEIAMNCGFCSSSYFGKIFKERMGVTPREYRFIQ